MSTRSNIAIKRKDGSIDSIYCHSDGYLEYNGVMLNTMYINSKKVNNLIKLGDISFLDRYLKPDPTIPHNFDYEQRQHNVTVAYHRDRGDKLEETKFRHYNNMKDYISSFETSWYEYAYMFDEETNKWFWSEVPFGNNKNLEFKSLEDTLKAMRLISKPDKKLDGIIKQEIQFEKDYDLFQFNDVYESDEDAYYECERLLSSKDGIDGLIMTIKQYTDILFEENDLEQEKEIKKIYDEGRNLIKSLKEYRKDFVQKKDKMEHIR